MSTVATLVQIFFWATTATLAILAYQNAKKTIFQPIRTEIFKKQIETLSEVLRLFIDDVTRTNPGGLDTSAVLQVNLARMYDSYLEFAFNLKRPDDVIEYRDELCPTSWIHRDEIFLANDDKQHVPPTAQQKRPDVWLYQTSQISIPKEFQEQLDRFDKLLRDPLLPSSMVTRIERFLEDIRANVWLISGVIREVSIEMPERYPTLEDLQQSSYTWVMNRYNAKCKRLESAVDEISAAARSYFDPDNLIEPRKSQNSSSIRSRFIT